MDGGNVAEGSVLGRQLSDEGFVDRGALKGRHCIYTWTRAKRYCCCRRLYGWGREFSNKRVGKTGSGTSQRGGKREWM